MSPITWVAEIGSAHKGEKSLAYEMIRRFSEAGATICKFQFGWNRRAQYKMGLKYNPVRYVDPWADDLKKWCDYFGVELMASIWSDEGIETAKKVRLKKLKIAHQLDDHPQLVEKIYMAAFEMHYPSIYTSAEKQNHRGAALLYCPHQYPTYPEDLHIPDFGRHYYGYSDHSHGIAPCLLAVARGALYIEKHVTLDKTDLTVRDTPFSADPQEFAEMVRLGKEMRRLLDAGV